MPKRKSTNAVLDLELVRESEKAYLLKFPGDDDDTGKWIPKSLVSGKLNPGLNQGAEIATWKCEQLNWI